MSEPEFFRRLRGVVVKYGGKICRFNIAQVGDAGKQTGANVHEVTEIQGRAPDEICAEVEDAIQNDSANFPGLIRYEIVALDKEGTVLGGRIVLERRGRGKQVDESEQIEDATPRGHASQMMRQNETMFRTTLGNNQVMMQIMQETIRDLAAQNTRLVNDSMQVKALGEDLLDRRMERDLRMADEKRTRDIKDKAIGVVMTHGPALLAKLTAGTPVVGTATAEIVMGQQMKILLDGFKKDPERFGKICSMLKPEEMLGLVEHDLTPLLLAIEKDPARFAQLGQHLTQEEAVAVMQLAEQAEAERAKKKAAEEAAKGPEKTPDIVVTEVKNGVHEGKPS